MRAYGLFAFGDERVKAEQSELIFEFGLRFLNDDPSESTMVAAVSQ